MAIRYNFISLYCGDGFEVAAWELQVASILRRSEQWYRLHWCLNSDWPQLAFILADTQSSLRSQTSLHSGNIHCRWQTTTKSTGRYQESVLFSSYRMNIQPRKWVWRNALEKLAKYIDHLWNYKTVDYYLVGTANLNCWLLPPTKALLTENVNYPIDWNRPLDIFPQLKLLTIIKTCQSFYEGLNRSENRGTQYHKTMFFILVHYIWASVYWKLK